MTTRLAFESHTDERLLDLLVTEGDRLSREAVDEFLRRGSRLVPALGAILKNEEAWQERDDLFWRPIHATFILGAIGGEAAVDGLIAAIRFSDEHEVDWVLGPLSDMFGRIGPAAIIALRGLLEDVDQSTYVRGLAAECLGAVAAQHEAAREGVLDGLRAFVENPEEDEEVRAWAANALLDFARPQDERLLRRFASRFDDESFPLINSEAAEGAYAHPERNTLRSRVERDWLEFYSAEVIAARQARWADEAVENEELDGVGGEDEIPLEAGNEIFATPQPLQGVKAGRNAPCPCGSGTKYKKCCGKG